MSEKQILEAVAESERNASSWNEAREMARSRFNNTRKDERKRNHYTWYEYVKKHYTNGILY